MKVGARAHNIGQVEAVARKRVEFVEINLCDPLEAEKEINELQRIRKQYDVGYLAHGPNEGDPRDIDRLSGGFLNTLFRLIELACLLEIPLFTIHLWMDGRFIDKRFREKKLRLLERIAAFGCQQGISVCLENLSERLCDLSQVFERVEDLGLTLDLGHGQLMTTRNTAFEFMEHYPEKICHVHAHDNFGGKRVEDDIHLPIGEGIIDFRTLLGRLLGTGYGGTISLEVKPEEISRSRRRLEEILREIKGSR